MKKVSIDDLLSNDAYQNQRNVIRKAIIDHKKNRRVQLGPNITLHFEDYMTMRYQVQELMRTEKLSEVEEIREELDVYNPLIPDGKNLKATLMIEYPDEEERRVQLSKLVGIENSIAIKIGESEPVYPIANEDLERSTEDKTSSVHFLRFEFSDDAIQEAKNQANWSITCGHDNYPHQLPSIPDSIRASLLGDFD
jgi:hypothetical protein